MKKKKRRRRRREGEEEEEAKFKVWIHVLGCMELPWK